MANKKVKINISHISKLANLPLTAKEQSIYTDQLTKILGYVEQIEAVDTKNIAPTFNISTDNKITRADVVNNGLTQSEALQNTSSKKNGYVLTKGVFSNE